MDDQILNQVDGALGNQRTLFSGLLKIGIQSIVSRKKVLSTTCVIGAVF